MDNLYNIVKNDFDRLMSSKFSRETFCPYKLCLSLEDVNGVATKTLTVMPAKDDLGNYGEKTIYIDDETSECVEVYSLNGHIFQYDNFTVERCALMNKYTLEACGLKPKKVGFIGNGRINLATKKLLNPKKVVIHGAKGREDKNKELFGDCIVDYDFSELNKCDVVFVCTNSYLKENLIETDKLKANLIIALDCGYTLGESFRKEYKSFSEYPEQLMADYSHEFPFDSMKALILPLSEIRKCLPRKKCVYLHGTALSDLSLAKAIHPEYAETTF